MVAPAFPASLPPAAFARLVGLSPSRLRELAGTGAILRNERGHYDLPTALHSYLERLRGQAAARTSSAGHDLVAERSRLAAAQADLAELRVAQERGELVAVRPLQVAMATMVTTVRNRILAVPPTARGQLPHLSVDDIETLEDMLAEALTELSRDPRLFGLDAYDGDEDDGEKSDPDDGGDDDDDT